MESVIDRKTNKFILIYYSILLFVLFAHGANSSPNILLRTFFLLAFTLPLCKIDLYYTPIIVPVFAVISTHVGESYLPVQNIQYILLVVFICISHRKNLIRTINMVPNYIWLLIVHTFVVNVCASFSLESITSSFLLLVMLISILQYKSDEFIKVVFISYSILSLFLSLFFLLYRQQFGDNAISIEGDFEVYGWMDRNYFSSALGMGVMPSFFLLLHNRRLDVRFKLLVFFSIAVTLLSMVIVASRGGLLAIIVAMSFYVMNSRVSLKYKIVSALLAATFLVIIYELGYFAFLEYRMTEEDSLANGSGRTETWALKLSHYLNDLTPIQQLFGIGFQNGLVLGSGNKVIGFHNDFVAILIDYGVFGLVLFLITLVNPILESKVMRKETITMVIYMLFCSLTLEGYSSGRMAYFFFYIPILLLSRVKNYN